MTTTTLIVAQAAVIIILGCWVLVLRARLDGAVMKEDLEPLRAKLRELEAILDQGPWARPGFPRSRPWGRV